jgi:hypothetical protein
VRRADERFRKEREAEKEGWYRYGDSNPGSMAEKRGSKRRR